MSGDEDKDEMSVSSIAGRISEARKQDIKSLHENELDMMDSVYSLNFCIRQSSGSIIAQGAGDLTPVQARDLRMAILATAQRLEAVENGQDPRERLSSGGNIHQIKR